MCGINGFSWNDSTLIDKMNEAIKHRGPDDQGTYLDENVSLGHRRLSIIDLSPAGRQPMANEDMSVWIVFNGEIYNFAEIRKDLLEKGHGFRSNTDTEVIIHAYEEWGYDCVEKFNGMWAFAVYDKNKGLLFLSRDRFGVKPLYYYHKDDRFIFSSEIKGLLEYPIERAPNNRAIYEYLAFSVLDHRRDTFFKGIFRVMPGENLVYDLSQKTLETKRWYDLRSRIKKVNSVSEEDLSERLKDLFKDCVRYRLIADVPVGSCLSGGLDSSAIVYAMRDLERNGQIKTFSMVFPGKDIDESRYIDEVAKDTEVESYKVTPTAADLMRDLSDFIFTQEEPFRTASTYGHYRVMELAHKKGMKVLLDGQGADETLAGYIIYYKYYVYESLIKLRLNEAIEAARANRSLSDLALFPFKLIASHFMPAERVMRKVWTWKLKYLNWFYDGDSDNPLSERSFDLNSALYSDLITFSIPQLLRYEDKNSMRWSIESRVPFLDYRLVEFVASLPSCCKINSGSTKYLFRRAFRDLVSDKILERKDKIGFKAPEKDWWRDPAFAEMAEKVIKSREFKSRIYWKPEEVERLFQEHTGGIKDHSEDLWKVICVELWIRRFIEGACEKEDIGFETRAKPQPFSAVNTSHR